jgi:hypothetical protein
LQTLFILHSTASPAAILTLLEETAGRDIAFEYDGKTRHQTKNLQKIKLAFEQGVQQFKVKEGYGLPFLGCIIAAETKGLL